MIGIIYKIKCNITNEIYIGSSINFNDRINKHKCLKYNVCKSKQIIERNNYNFYILDKREFPNILSLQLLENLYIIIGKKYCNCINHRLAYSNKNIEKHNEKIYRIKNKEREKLRSKEYRENNIEKEKLIRKKYKDSHKEEIKEYEKIRYQRKKDYYKRRLCCIKCRKELAYGNLKNHIIRKHT